jgi:predicted nucleic acid-binding protein
LKIAIDLNVLLDVAQNRAAFYQDSEEVLARAREGEYEGVIAGHLVTTFYYLLVKFAGAAAANVAVDGLLGDFAVVGADKQILAKARKLPMTDFEDGVVAATADSSSCDYIVTRNAPDFAGSPVPAITPADFLKLLLPSDKNLLSARPPVLSAARVIKALVADRDYLYMFMEEVEQADAFWLWHRYASGHRQEEAELGHQFQIFAGAIFHASLLSARKLNDFFTGGRGRSDDIKADRYGFQDMTPPLNGALLDKLNKYLAHMTFPGADLRMADWDTNEFLRPILLRSFEFCLHVERRFLDPKTDGQIIGDVAKFRKEVLWRIKRTESPTVG